MEIEYIDEDTIRVRIKNSDLEARGYTFLDLLGNQQQIEEFFYKILEEVDQDRQFRDSESVTFQVMPSSTGLELLISKDMDVHENLVSNVDYEDLDELFLEQELQEVEETKKLDEPADNEMIDGEERVESEKIEKERKIVIEFNTFEQMIQLAQTIKEIGGISSLYQLGEKYYLDFQLIQEEFSFRSLDEKVGILLEYGRKSKVTSEVLSEHGNLLIEDDALSSIFYYFK